jgi:hypothetical protein
MIRCAKAQSHAPDFVEQRCSANFKPRGRRCEPPTTPQLVHFSHPRLLNSAFPRTGTWPSIASHSAAPGKLALAIPAVRQRTRLSRGIGQQGRRRETLAPRHNISRFLTICSRIGTSCVHAVIRASRSAGCEMITSAWHMSRAMGCFRSVGFHVEPWPVDYRTSGRVFKGPAANRYRCQGIRGACRVLPDWPHGCSPSPPQTGGHRKSRC